MDVAVQVPLEHTESAELADSGGRLDALSRASSLELFQLQAIIDRMLADPKRIIAVRATMHLGQTVRFLDWRGGQMREGKVVQMRLDGRRMPSARWFGQRSGHQLWGSSSSMRLFRCVGKRVSTSLR